MVLNFLSVRKGVSFVLTALLEMTEVIVEMDRGIAILKIKELNIMREGNCLIA